MHKLWATSMLVSIGFATGAAAADISVHDAWARATSPAATTAAVYLSITGADDKLVAVASPEAAKAAIHETYRKGTVVGMRAVADGLALNKTGPTVLSPGGYHIMLETLAKPLAAGSTFPLTLTFEKAGKVETSVHVEAADANGPTQDAGPGHDMEMKPGNP